MKILNLYCGIGGNRKLWGNEHDITAIELNPQIAKIYQDFFPQDRVIVADAHQYLLEHFSEFDFIWSSPPCPSHSRFRYIQPKKVYPDMTLWQEIIFLQYWFKGKYCVENVVTYYEPLIKPTKCDNHYFWSNFYITSLPDRTRNVRRQNNSILERELDFNFVGKEIEKRLKEQVLINCVKPDTGLHILNESKKELYQDLFNRKS